MSSDCPTQSPSTAQTKALTKRGEKRRLALLTTAYDLFLEHGYDDVSLDNIIQMTGGSKTSIYHYFGDKEGLFKAVCDYHFSQKTHKFIIAFQDNCDLRLYLKKLLLNFYEELNQEKDTKFLHLIIQQSHHKPELMHDLYQRWCNEVQKNLENILARCHQLNYIHCPNPTFSAMFFWGIINDARWKNLMNLPLENVNEFSQYLDYSINIFLLGHHYQTSS